MSGLEFTLPEIGCLAFNSLTGLSNGVYSSRYFIRKNNDPHPRNMLGTALFVSTFTSGMLGLAGATILLSFNERHHEVLYPSENAPFMFVMETVYCLACSILGTLVAGLVTIPKL